MAPTTPANEGSSRPVDLRVLVTGFGPFAHYTINPSWLSVRKLSNAVLEVGSDDEEAVNKKKLAHVTTVLVPVTYDDVLSIVPDLHSRPPRLPERDPTEKDALAAQPVPDLPIPQDGYDLVLHVGVAGSGDMRVEHLGHKTGYRSPDVKGQYAPVVKVTLGLHQDGEGVNGNGSVGGQDEHEVHAAHPSKTSHIHGFAHGFEAFADELTTVFDTKALVQHMHSVGIADVVESSNAGRYLCDFIYYCSLAESERSSASEGAGKGKKTPVLFLHCPPVDMPLSSDDVAHAIEVIVKWCLSQVQE